MKILHLIRHAKSSWDYPELDDFERPLNKRGKHDIPLIGRQLLKRKVNPDLIISSPALRAATTARGLAEIIKYPLIKIRYVDQIYDSSAYNLLDIIKEQKNKYKVLFLIAHNPGLTSLANLLCDTYVDNIPTCGIYCLKMNITNWSDAQAKCATLNFFDFPKKLKEDT